MPLRANPRMQIQGIRQPRGGIMRGQTIRARPVVRTRARGQRMPISQPRFNSNLKASYTVNGNYGNDVIIPTINPGYQSAPDLDIIADDEIQLLGNGQDDNIMGGQVDASEEEANLARLPQFIQIQKVVEHEILQVD